MTTAAPRWNANGDDTIRPYRTGSSSATHAGSCRPSNSTGSARNSGGSNTALV